MPDIGAPELIIIAIVILLLFGATKLPTFARSMGRSMRIFKSEVKGMQNDDKDDLDGLKKDDKAEAKAEPQQLTEKPTGSTAAPTVTDSVPTETVSDREEQRAGEQR